MIFDLFKLHSKKDTANSWIWIEIDHSFINRYILDYFNKNSKNEVARIISKKLNCGFSTIFKHLCRIINNKEVKIPLPIIIELINLINPKVKIKAIKSIKYFWTYKDKTKKRIVIPYKINELLAKIIGGHIADGHMQKDKLSYKINISHGRKEDLNFFGVWIKQVFNIDGRMRFSKKDNTWSLWYSNKIIGKFFENIAKIKAGKKFHIVKEPEIIKNSSLNIRNAFALGVMTFDGTVKTCGIISIRLKSKRLINDLEKIFQLNNIKLNKIYNLNKDIWILESNSGRNISYLTKWQRFFEPKSWKSSRLNFFINPYNCSIEELELLFPRYYNNKIGISDVWKVIKYIKSGKICDIQRKLKIKGLKVANTTLHKYLQILHKSNLMQISYEKYSDIGWGGRKAIYSLKCQL